jgi:hypothetical protein
VARDEFNGGLYTSQVANTPGQYQEMLQQQFGDRTSMVMSLYPLARFPNSSPFIAYRTVMADAFSVCPALVADQQLARHIPVYAFENDNATTPQGAAGRRRELPLGAFHNGENPFLFPSANGPDLPAPVTPQWTAPPTGPRTAKAGASCRWSPRVTARWYPQQPSTCSTTATSGTPSTGPLRGPRLNYATSNRSGSNNRFERRYDSAFVMFLASTIYAGHYAKWNEQQREADRGFFGFEM